MPVPTAEEFRKKFVEVFNECCKGARHNSFEQAWKNWTAFMTGKKTKVDSWSKRAVLPSVAKKFGLLPQEEFMRIDLVFYQKGRCPLAVAVEHENDSRDFKTELERLFSVRSRLKVGINYAWHGSQEFDDVKRKLKDSIHEYWKYYVNGLLPEPPQTEYLFLLGNEKTKKSITWHHISFKAPRGPGRSNFEVS
ncbi:MAG: hypothetical protein WA639_22605 [Candidatus Acidiferrum sp.]